MGSADPAESARAICLRQLTAGPRTRVQLGRVLAGKGIPDDVAASVLDRFETVGLIDDAAFAHQWVASRHRTRGLSRQALSRELRTRGVGDDLVAEALDDLDPHEETETARRLVSAKLRATSGLDVTVRVRRLAGMLARKGYPPGLSLRVVREALALEADVDAPGRRYLDSLDGPLSDAARVGD